MHSPYSPDWRQSSNTRSSDSLIHTTQSQAQEALLHQLAYSDELVSPGADDNWRPPSPYAETENGENALFHSQEDEEEGEHDALVDRQVDESGSPGNDIFAPRRYARLIPTTDTIFVLLYYACAVAMVFIGTALLFTSNPSYRSDKDPPSSGDMPIDPRTTSKVLTLIYESSGVLAVMVLLSTLLGAFWILLLGAFVKQIVWSTILFIPISCFGLSVWSSVLLLSPPPGVASQVNSYSQITFLVMLLVTTTVSGTAFSILTYLQRARIDTTVVIIRLSTEILSANPHIFTLSLYLLSVYALFIVMWVMFVTKLVQMTSVVVFLGKTLSGEGTWLDGLRFTPTLMFFIFMLLWTTCLFGNIHRMTISGIVHHWYFHRHTPTRLTGSARATWALKRSVTSLFGTACFGGLVISAVQASQIIHSVYRKHLRKSLPLPDTPAFMSSLVAFLSRMLIVINHYTLIYAAITGHSFITSARNSTRLFQRTLTEALIRDLFTRAVLLLGNVILCGVVGMAMVSLVRRDQVSDNGTAGIVVIGMWISWGVMRFWGEVMINVYVSFYFEYSFPTIQLTDVIFNIFLALMATI